MAKIYTKTGDKGTTSLVNGTKVSKANKRIDLYGEVDELNSYIGLVKSLMDQQGIGEKLVILHKIQNNLFNLGSLLACESSFWEKYDLPKLELKLTSTLEMAIDEMEKILPPLKNFILPGGSCVSSHAQICRTVCRRVERKLVTFEALSPTEVPEGAKELLNRLSDYFFVLARYLNIQKGVDEILWNSRNNGN